MDEEIIIPPDNDGGEELVVYIPGEKPISFLRCSRCYIGSKCPGYKEDAETCMLREAQKKVDVYSPQGLQSFVLDILALQAERIMRMAAFEDIEGGLADPRVTEEIMVFMTLLEKMKKLSSKGQFELFIRGEGESAASVMEKIFGRK